MTTDDRKTWVWADNRAVLTRKGGTILAEGVPDYVNNLETTLQQAQQRAEDAEERARRYIAERNAAEATIEQLRAEITDLTTRNDQLLVDGKHWLTIGRENDELRAENERLRESLTTIRDLPRHDFCTSSHAGIAKAALAGQPGGKEGDHAKPDSASPLPATSLHRLAARLATALKALDSLYSGFAEVVRTEDWGDAWYESAIPEVREAFTLAAAALADYAAWEQHEKDDANAERISVLIEELWKQWEVNHWEHCGKDFPHALTECRWPPPAVLVSPESRDIVSAPLSLGEDIGRRVHHE